MYVSILGKLSAHQNIMNNNDPSKTKTLVSEV